MKNLKNSKTYENLARAFAGECQAHVRYMFIEYGARNEGYVALSEIIDKVVYEEFNHARMLYSFLQTADENVIKNIDIPAGFPFKQKWNLLDNLAFAAEDEKNEAEKIYPEFMETAKKEGFNDIAGLFENLIQVETCHEKLFLDLHEQLKDSTLYKRPKAVKWKCSGCGYETTAESAPKECPLCHAKQGAFMLKLNDGN